ncbi:TrkH family potassium uptake protein [Alsobacter sp. SYSU BS001988]
MSPIGTDAGAPAIRETRLALRFRIPPPTRTGLSVIDLRAVAYPVALLLTLLGALMGAPAAADLAAGQEGWRVFALAGGLTVFAGAALALATRQTPARAFRVREAFLFVTMAWLVLASFAATPFWLGEAALSYPAALFEAMSGLTASGGTAIRGLDGLSAGPLLWRAMLNGLGGAGALMLGVVVLPALQVGGAQVARVEAAPRRELLYPRARTMAGRILAAYAGLIAACAACYGLSGMSAFDAVAHALATVSTGGFSTHDASIGHFRSAGVEWTAILFMISGALPLAVFVRALRGDAGAPWRSHEIRAFGAVGLSAAALLALSLAASGAAPGPGLLREGLFAAVSTLTTTGFRVSDGAAWSPFAQAVLFSLLFVGGCGGSTAGGLKLFRILILGQTVKQALRRIRLPHSVTPLTFDGAPVDNGTALAVVSFLIAYVAAVLAAALALNLTGLGLGASLSTAAAQLSNTGPGFGAQLGQGGAYAGLPAATYGVLVATMLLGRLEIFTLFVLFMPRFWRG